MEWWLLTFFFSAILSLFLPIVPEFSLLFLFLLSSLALIFIAKFRLLATILFAVTWVLIAGVQFQQRLENNNIDHKLLHKNSYVIQGKISNIVNEKKSNYRFNFHVTHWQGEKLSTAFNVRLSWKRPIAPLKQGQIWQLAVKLKPAHGLANIGGFNYQVWLLQQHIVATGYVKADKSTVDSAAPLKRNILLVEQITWRQSLYQKLSRLLVDNDLNSLIFALGFGERGKLTQEHWRVLSATATQHLIAISGLHIGIIAFASLLLMRTLIKVFPIGFLLTLPQQLQLMRINVSYAAVLFSCLMAWYYAYLAGFSIPTLRALVMLLLFWLFKFIAVKVALLRWLLIAIVLILLIWPLSIISTSFWLSISALVIIFATCSRFPDAVSKAGGTNKDVTVISNPLSTHVTLNRWQKFKVRSIVWLKALVAIQLALTVLMLPIAASLNYQVPLAAFFANIIAVPLMSITVIPLTLLAVIVIPFNATLAYIFTDLALMFLAMIWQWLSYLADANWAIVAVSFEQLQYVTLLLIIVSVGLFFRLSMRKVFASLSLLLVSAIFDFVSPKFDNNWQLTVLDVGHGLAVVIEKNRKVFLYDTGASYPSGFNMADAAILPYLKHHGYQSIDGVIISHSDNDHAGGLKHLRANIAINTVIANDITLRPNRLCISRQSFHWQGLMFNFLAPNQPVGEKNDDSCVLLISDGLHRVLIPGDISTKQERRLLLNANTGDKLKSDLLIAPHHGSKSSSSIGFLKRVAPSYVVFSTGYLNRWDMPSEAILSRYSKLNIDHFNTAELGMIRFNFGRGSEHKTEQKLDKLVPVKNIEISSYRKNMRPYWFVN